MKAVLLFALMSVVCATYYQLQCLDDKCSQNCQKISFPEDQCIPVSGGGAAKVKCMPNYLQEEVWRNSDCSGTPAATSRDKLAVCEDGGGGVYYENICSAGLMLNNATRSLL